MADEEDQIAEVAARFNLSVDTVRNVNKLVKEHPEIFGMINLPTSVDVALRAKSYAPPPATPKASIDLETAQNIAITAALIALKMVGKA